MFHVLDQCTTQSIRMMKHVVKHTVGDMIAPTPLKAFLKKRSSLASPDVNFTI